MRSLKLRALPVPRTGSAEAQARRDLLKLALSSLAAAVAAWVAGALAVWFRHPAEETQVSAPPPSSASISTPPPATLTELPSRATPTATPASAAPSPANLSGGCVLQPVVAPTPYPGRIKFGDLDPSTGLHVTGQGKVMDVATYYLDVTGKVDRPLRFTYDDLRCLPKNGADVTLVCVGYFEDEAGWEGAGMKALLQMAGVQKDAQGIRMTGADGYHSAVPIDTALEHGNFLAYELEGNPLPILHGFPVRAMFPALHGDVDVKWLVKIEVY